MVAAAVAAIAPAAGSDGWWAFRPRSSVTPPALENDHSQTRARNGIDQFVFHRLAQQNLSPAPSADKPTRLRRLYYDLIGLPPTPGEMDAFLQDEAPDAWERQIDVLLEDPRYGEHWATLWLDLVRYSESDGWNQDAYRPHIWRYRDYVVKAFNEDKPYTDFVREQLAGDEMPGGHPDHLEAAGFLRLGIFEYNQRDARGHWNDIMNEMTDTVGDVFLGLSMACARCHDHKFDDISQRDYFRLRAFFEPIIWRDDLKAATLAEKAAYADQLAVWNEATEEIRGEIDALVKPYHDRKWKTTVEKFPLDIQACFLKPEHERNSWEHQMAYLVSRQFLEEGGGPLKNISQEDQVQHEALKKKLAAFDHLKPKALPPVMTVKTFAGPSTPTTIPGDKGKTAVSPGFLTALSPHAEPATDATQLRTTLAAWITDPDNPLTTRVIVNRIWQRHFGRGLVSTPNNFGHKGSRPSHPELLDWLTERFIEDGWRFKQLHRLILTSATWQQASDHPESSNYKKHDPENTLLWSAPVRRLRAESIRDSMLHLSGELQSKLGGPSVDAEVPRRSLYVKRFRNDNETFLHAFDMTSGLKSMAQRNSTTTPTQSLTMFNSRYTLERAEVWADRLCAQHAATPSLLHQAMRSAWGRPPSPAELDDALQFVGQDPQTSRQRVADFCHVLLNSNEFLYVP